MDKVSIRLDHFQSLSFKWKKNIYANIFLSLFKSGQLIFIILYSKLINFYSSRFIFFSKFFTILHLWWKQMDRVSIRLDLFQSISLNVKKTFLHIYFYLFTNLFCWIWYFCILKLSICIYFYSEFLRVYHFISSAFTRQFCFSYRVNIFLCLNLFIVTPIFSNPRFFIQICPIYIYVIYVLIADVLELQYWIQKD